MVNWFFPERGLVFNIGFFVKGVCECFVNSDISYYRFIALSFWVLGKGKVIYHFIIISLYHIGKSGKWLEGIGLFFFFFFFLYIPTLSLFGFCFWVK